MSADISNCLIIAGEKSGEEHALSFLPYLKSQYPDLKFWGVGGSQLEQEGVEILYNLKEFSSWGYSGVFSRVPFYIKAYRHILDEVQRRSCKVAILIDFQTFNMKLAKRLSEKGVKVLYYVAPQAWAWKKYRAKKLAKSVHSLFTIIPFEKQWFLNQGVARVHSVPHPIWFHYRGFLEQSQNLIKNKGFPENRKVNIVLLPGSRSFEIQEQLPIFMKVVSRLKKIYPLNIEMVISSNVDTSLYEPFLKDIDYTYQDESLKYALVKSDLALASSGTVTLTSALFEVPTVVSYRSSLLNQFIFETFVNYKGYISLANIIHEKEIFPEFIQDEVSVYNLEKALIRWLDSKEYFYQTKSSLSETKNLIGGDQIKTANLIAEVLGESYAQ